MKRHLFFIECTLLSVLILAGCGTNLKNSPFKFDENAPAKPVVIVTDFGRDVDDAEAIAWLAGCKNINIAGVIVAGNLQVIKARSITAFLNLCGIKAPVAFLKEPSFTEEALYMSKHSASGEAYELTLEHKLAALPQNEDVWQRVEMLRKFNNPTKMLDSICNKYPGEVELLVLAQPTEIATYINGSDSSAIGRDKNGAMLDSVRCKFKEVVIQGLMRKEQTDGAAGCKIVPDYSSANLGADSLASQVLFSLQEKVPFVFVGKNAAYASPITKKLGKTFVKNGFAYPEKKLDVKNLKAVMDYISTDRNLGLQCLLYRERETFYRIFQIRKSVPFQKAMKKVNLFNYPYDLLAAIYVSNPEVYKPEEVKGKNQIHKVINSEKEFKDKNFLKYIIR